MLEISLQLPSQSKHLHVDAAIENIFVDARRLQEMLAGEGSLRGVEKGDQQSIFALGQRNRRAIGVGQAARAPIDLPAAKPIATAFGIPLRRRAPGLPPAQHSPDPREEFTQSKRFGDIVVGAQLEVRPRGLFRRADARS